MRFTARARLETWAHASRVQSDEVTYDFECTDVGSVVAGVTADCCCQCGACDRALVPVAVGDREADDMEVKDALVRAQAWLTAAQNRGINIDHDHDGYLSVIRDLFELVKKRENDLMAAQNGLTQMMLRQSLATGHGDTIADLIRELEWQINADRERHHKDTAVLRARLDAMVKDVADSVAIQPPNPVVVECECPVEGHQPGCELDRLVRLAKEELDTYIEKPHGPVNERLMQKFYGAKR